MTDFLRLQVDAVAWKFYDKIGFEEDDSHKSDRDCTAMSMADDWLQNLYTHMQHNNTTPLT